MSSKHNILQDFTFVTMFLSYLEYIYAHQLKGLINGESHIQIFVQTNIHCVTM